MRFKRHQRLLLGAGLTCVLLGSPMALMPSAVAQRPNHFSLPLHHMRYLQLSGNAARFVGEGNFAAHSVEAIQMLGGEPRKVAALYNLIRGHEHRPVLAHDHPDGEQHELSTQVYAGNADANAWLKTNTAQWFIEASNWLVPSASSPKGAEKHVTIFPHEATRPKLVQELYSVGVVGEVAVSGQGWTGESSVATVHAPLEKRTLRFEGGLPGIAAERAPVFGITLSRALDTRDAERYGRNYEAVALFAALDQHRDPSKAAQHVQFWATNGPLVAELFAGKRPALFSEALWNPMWNRLFPMAETLPKIAQQLSFDETDSLLFSSLANPQAHQNISALHLLVSDNKGQPIHSVATSGLGKQLDEHWNRSLANPTQNPKHALLEELIGYRFKDEQLLEEALVHRSILNEENTLTVGKNNERLEFLGDATISTHVSSVLFTREPRKDEDGLTKIRADIVNAAGLARAARGIGLHQFLYIGKSPLRDNYHRTPRGLSSFLESVIGAANLDGGFEAGRSITLYLLDPYVATSINTITSGKTDPKSQLQEYVQSDGTSKAHYKIVKLERPKTDKPIYTVAAMISGKEIAQGEPRIGRQAAEFSAAEAALKVLGVLE